MTPEQRAAALERLRITNTWPADKRLSACMPDLLDALDELDARDVFERQQSATIDDCVARIADLENAVVYAEQEAVVIERLIREGNYETAIAACLAVQVSSDCTVNGDARGHLLERPLGETT